MAKTMTRNPNPVAPSDTIPAMLTPGEFVINREAVGLLGAKNLAEANKAGLAVRSRGYADGGYVSQMTNADIAMRPHQWDGATGGVGEETDRQPLIGQKSTSPQQDNRNFSTTNNATKNVTNQYSTNFGSSVQPSSPLDLSFLQAPSPLSDNSGLQALKSQLVQGFANGGEVYDPRYLQQMANNERNQLPVSSPSEFSAYDKNRYGSQQAITPPDRNAVIDTGPSAARQSQQTAIKSLQPITDTVGASGLMQGINFVNNRINAAKGMAQGVKDFGEAAAGTVGEMGSRVADNYQKGKATGYGQLGGAARAGLGLVADLGRDIDAAVIQPLARVGGSVGTGLYDVVNPNTAPANQVASIPPLAATKESKVSVDKALTDQPATGAGQVAAPTVQTQSTPSAQANSNLPPLEFRDYRGQKVMYQDLGKGTDGSNDFIASTDQARMARVAQGLAKRGGIGSIKRGTPLTEEQRVQMRKDNEAEYYAGKEREKQDAIFNNMARLQSIAMNANADPMSRQAAMQGLQHYGGLYGHMMQNQAAQQAHADNLAYRQQDKQEARAVAQAKADVDAKRFESTYAQKERELNQKSNSSLNKLYKQTDLVNGDTWVSGRDILSKQAKDTFNKKLSTPKFQDLLKQYNGDSDKLFNDYLSEYLAEHAGTLQD